MPDTFARALPDYQSLCQAFQAGEDTPSAALERHIDAIEAAEDTVKAFTHIDLASARKAAAQSTERYKTGQPLSPIDGLVIGVKDIIETADMPTGMNNDIFAGHMARADAACVRAVREGGAVVIGKTVTTEFAIGRSGPTVNPHDVERTPGGSSSGSAAGVAAGMFALGFGTQTQGSVIRPASFNGVVGYKPTLNALSTDGIHPLSRSHDHLGMLACCVDTAWRTARWISEQAPGQDGDGLGGPGDGRLPAVAPARVAVARTRGFEDLDAESAQAFDDTLARLRRAGVEVVEPAEDPLLAGLITRLDRIVDISIRMVAFDMRWPFRGYMKLDPDALGPRLHELMKLSQDVTLDEYRDMRAARADMREAANELGRSYDAFVLPAASGPAPKGFSWTGARTLLLYWSFLGFPCFSLPVMRAEGMPFGLQFAGVGGADFQLAQRAKWTLEALKQA